jgi:predicted AlkP superfamily pyrophosphatase or phosphodiesterase
MRTRPLMRGRSAIFALVAALILGACAGGRPPEGPAPQAPSGPFQDSGGVNRPEHRSKPHAILISFDGFRPDYLDRFDLPNFKRVLERGVRARAMIPVFPSMTFPNHYSLVTGLYAERHGIVGNSFYDPVRDRTYSLSDRTAVADGSWYRGEPIWVTAERQGMVTAPYFWPGSEAAIKGVRPTFWKPFDNSLPNDDRVKDVLEALQLPDETRPHFLTLYFSELDSVSHRNPLDSPEIERAARSLDRSLGLLLDGIERLPIRDLIYLVLASDHGMAETGRAQTVQLDTILGAGRVHTSFGGPVASLHVKGAARVAQQIRDELNARLDHGRAYLRAEVPDRYRYRDDPRIGDVVVVMNEGWTLETSPLRSRPVDRWGMHGWDPALPSMHAMFVVSGPGTRRGATVSNVLNVDVYSFLAELLELQPAPDLDGQAGRIRPMVIAKE